MWGCFGLRQGADQDPLPEGRGEPAEGGGGVRGRGAAAAIERRTEPSEVPGAAEEGREPLEPRAALHGAHYPWALETRGQ